MSARRKCRESASHASAATESCRAAAVVDDVKIRGHRFIFIPWHTIADARSHKAWLARNPRVYIHFVPTNSSWLNLIEQFFSELSQRQLKRLAAMSVDELIYTIMRYITSTAGAKLKPFVCTESVQHILEKVTKARTTFEALH